MRWSIVILFHPLQQTIATKPRTLTTNCTEPSEEDHKVFSCSLTRTKPLDVLVTIGQASVKATAHHDMSWTSHDEEMTDRLRKAQISLISPRCN